MSAEAQARRTRVMIVEDHADFRALMEVLLGRQPDIDLLAQAGSLAEARAQAARLELDVAVLDLGLPDGSGLELMRRLRARRDLPGIALTGFGRDEDITQCREAGFDAHLVKPADPTAIQELLAVSAATA